MADKCLIILDRREFRNYTINIPMEQCEFFEKLMKDHGWKPQEKGSFKNKAICIDMDNMLQEGK